MRTGTNPIEVDRSWALRIARIDCTVLCKVRDDAERRAAESATCLIRVSDEQQFEDRIGTIIIL